LGEDFRDKCKRNPGDHVFSLSFFPLSPPSSRIFSPPFLIALIPDRRSGSRRHPKERSVRRLLFLCSFPFLFPLRGLFFLSPPLSLLRSYRGGRLESEREGRPADTGPLWSYLPPPFFFPFPPLGLAEGHHHRAKPKGSRAFLLRR